MITPCPLRNSRENRRLLKATIFASLLILLNCQGAPIASPTNSQDEFTSAVMHYEKEDLVNGYIERKFEELDKKGEIRATMWLARIYFRGRMGLSSEPFVAQEMAHGVLSGIIKLAEKGDNEAQFLLGSAYQEGLGVDADVEQAKKWLTRAADAGHITALNNLGSMVLQGQGFEPDLKKARELYSRAAAKGSVTAQNNLEICRIHRDRTPQLEELRSNPIIRVLGMKKDKGLEYLGRVSLIADPEDFIVHSSPAETSLHFKADGIVITIDINNRINSVEGHSAGFHESNAYKGPNPFNLSWESQAEVLKQKLGVPDEQFDTNFVEDSDGLIYQINNLNLSTTYAKKGGKTLTSWKVFERWAVNFAPVSSGAESK